MRHPAGDWLQGISDEVARADSVWPRNPFARCTRDIIPPIIHPNAFALDHERITYFSRFWLACHHFFALR
jgi:hypothetical protein